MAEITITVNDAEVRNMLNAAPNKLSAAMRGGMEDATTYTLARIRRYPRERPNQQYVRTNVLNKSWSRRIEGAGLTIRGIVGSNSAMAPYNRVVQDRDRQARIHRGRWQTIQDVAEQEQNTVVRMFADRIAAAGLER